jgi:CubicO group peptidase (beta-lactamase class C family)
MSKKKFLLLSLFGIAVLALAFKAFSSRSPKSKPARKRVLKGRSYSKIDSYFDRQMRRLKIPGAVMTIVEGDKITHLREFGKARPGGETPTPQTPFLIGSLTKAFTALAVMQLVENGKIKLDAPVQRYLPWFRFADTQESAKLTVRHLLNQTSGLSVISGWVTLADFDNRPDAAERQARALSNYKLTRPVGSKYEYCNMNYNLLGLIVEAATHESYEAYIEKHVFKPLEMRHSFTSQVEAKKNGLAVGHTYWFASPFPVTDLPLPRSSLASGQLICSIEDMAHFLIAHMNGGHYRNAKILSASGIAELHCPAVPAYTMGTQIGRYGMGWYNEVSGSTKTIWHSGTEPDFAAYMAFLPEQKKGIILFFNADHFMLNPVITEIGKGLVSLLNGQKPGPGIFSFIFKSMPALLLIPLLQAVGVTSTLRKLSDWQQNPLHRPSRGRLWGQHILLPLIPNLSLAAIPVSILISKMFGFLKLFAPDFTWVTMICGAFAGIWTFLRTGLILGEVGKPPRSG